MSLRRNRLVDWLHGSARPVGLVELAVGVAIGITTWPVAEAAPSVTIDSSWVAGLHLAARHGFSFGSDMLFTFGPLGFLGFPLPYMGWTSVLALAFVGAVHVGACIVMFHLARPAVGSATALLLVWATAFSFQWIPGWTLYGVLIFAASASAMLRHPGQRTGAGFAAILGIAVGLGALGKVNIALVSLVVAGVGVLTTARDARRSAVTFGISATAAFLAIWIAFGEHLGDLPAYLRGAIEISAGYGGSMGQIDPAASWASGVDALATGILAGFVWLRSAELPRRNQFLVWLLFAVMAFAAFKGGFTRQGVGMVIYLATLLALWPVVVPRKLPPVAIAMPVAGMLAMVLALTSLPIGTLVDPAGRLQALAHEAYAVVFQRSQSATTTGASLRSQYGLPAEAISLLAGHRVDIQPWQAAVAYAYPEITWRPQPVFQAYAAFTPYLDRQNADLLASAHAPDRMLWLTSPATGLSIDGRSVWFDSPLAKIEMICRYLPIGTGPNWQVLGRVSNRCGSPILIGSATSEAGGPVLVPRGLPPGILTVQISGMGKDLLSQLVTLAYRAPPWWMTFGGATYRIPLGIDGEPTILAATTDVGYAGALSLPTPPGTVTIGPDPGAPGDRSQLTLLFEVIPITQAPTGWPLVGSCRACGS